MIACLLAPYTAIVMQSGAIGTGLEGVGPYGSVRPTIEPVGSIARECPERPSRARVVEAGFFVPLPYNNRGTSAKTTGFLVAEETFYLTKKPSARLSRGLFKKDIFLSFLIKKCLKLSFFILI